MTSASPLPEAAGYAVVLGLGLAFALFMNGVTWIQKTFSQYSPNSASEFSAASRSLKTGLVVAGIVSSCEIPSILIPVSILIFFSTGTWSLTLLQSATQSYVMGVSGGYWYVITVILPSNRSSTIFRYAVGGTMQIAIFSVIASKVKINANRATTFPEVLHFLRPEESN